MRGPAPKSSRRKKVGGNAGKRRQAAQVAAASGLPKCPSWLPKNAAIEWERITRIIDPRAIGHADLSVLASYCVAWDELQAATETLAANGRVIYTEKGYPVQNPAVAMQRSAWAAIKTFAALLGLDPVNRRRIQLPDADDERADPLGEFLTGTNGKPKKK